MHPARQKHPSSRCDVAPLWAPLGAEATCVPSWPGRDADGKNKTWVLRNRAASLHLSGPGLDLGLGCVCIFGKKDLPRYDWELGPASRTGGGGGATSWGETEVDLGRGDGGERRRSIEPCKY